MSRLVLRNLLTLVLATSGCEAISGPGGYDVPNEDLSLDPSRLSLGYELYYCNDWNRSAGKPSATAMFADVFFYGSLPLARLDHPLAAQRFLVESVGAIIVRSYQGPGFRVWIERDSIPSLYGGGGVSIRSVPNPSRYDVQAAVSYGAPGVFGSPDSAHIAALGGRIIHDYSAIGFVVILIPSRMLDQIRADPRVDWIEMSPDFICPR